MWQCLPRGPFYWNSLNDFGEFFSPSKKLKINHPLAIIKHQGEDEDEEEGENEETKTRTKTKTKTQTKTKTKDEVSRVTCFSI